MPGFYPARDLNVTAVFAISTAVSSAISIILVNVVWRSAAEAFLAGDQTVGHRADGQRPLAGLSGVAVEGGGLHLHRQDPHGPHSIVRPDLS